MCDHLKQGGNKQRQQRENCILFKLLKVL